MLGPVEILIEDPRWHPVALHALAETAIRATLTQLALDPGQTSLSLLACDDARITTLNTDFRNKATPTNVLSWPSQDRAPAQPGAIPPAPLPDPDGTFELGDIALSYDTCLAEAEARKKPLNAHITHLIIHGVLHLLGYDHIYDKDAAVMEALEVEILGKLGLDDPYRE